MAESKKKTINIVNRYTKLIGLAVLGWSLLVLPKTGAWFFDEENSTNNVFSSLTLDAGLTGIEPGFVSGTVMAGEMAYRNYQATNLGLLPFNYSLKAVMDNHNLMCQELRAKLLLTTGGRQQLFSGKLADLWVNDDGLNMLMKLAPGSQVNFILELELPAGADDSLINQMCKFDLNLYARQEIGSLSGGYDDSEQVTNELKSGDWVNCQPGLSSAYAVVLTNDQVETADNILNVPDNQTAKLKDNGQILVKFDYPITDQEGMDLKIYQKTGKAFVAVGQDENHLVPLGETDSNAGGVGEFDINVTGLPWIKYVRLTGSGFEVDAVIGQNRQCDNLTLTCTQITGKKTEVNSLVNVANWQVAVVDLNKKTAEEITINANDLDGVETETTWLISKTYVVEASGTWINHLGKINEINVDAKDGGDNSLLVNNENIEWGSVNDNHKYMVIKNGDGNKWRFKVADEDGGEAGSGYSDNGGSLTVKIWEVTDAVVNTDTLGVYSFNACFAGEIAIVEANRENWQQILPVNPNYYQITLPNGAKDRQFDFVNKDSSIQPSPSLSPFPSATPLPGRVVINEVYYDVAPDKGADGNSLQSDEWIELYNAGETGVSLKNWQITDNSGNFKTVTTREITLAPHSFAVLAKSANTWTYWNIPDGAEKIELGEVIGNGLANNGDRVILKNSLGVVVDAVSWGTDISVFNPAVTDVAEGHSIVRSTLGQDTDTAADWADNITPNPGTNPHSHITAVPVQDGNWLGVNIFNAWGFDKVKYAISYDRLGENGEIVGEKINESEFSKMVETTEVSLPKTYLGTCSELNEAVCVAHTGITNGFVSLIYYLKDSILGISTVPFKWMDLK